MKRFAWVIIMLAVCLLGRKENVSAAGMAEMAVKGEAFSKGTKEWSVTCELNSSTPVTNGKVRITYDGSKLKLVSSEAGALLKGALPEINDPISGNKEEGEVVLVFASSGQIDAKGVLLNLKFQVMDAVSDGDEIQVSVKTEELISGSEGVETKDIPLAFAVGGSIRTPEETTKDSQGQSESREKETLQAGDSNPGAENTSAQNSSSASNPAASAKTADTTNAALPAAGAVLALLILAGLYFQNRKSLEEHP